MGFLNFFKRVPREFDVVIGDPWTINGKPTDSNTSEEVLEEIYDIAVLFPIEINVEGPERVLRVEMDEYGDTYPIDSVSKSGGQGEHHINLKDQSQLTDVATQADLAAEAAGEVAATDNPGNNRLQDFVQRLPLPRKKNAVIGAALGVVALVGLFVGVTGFGGNVSDEAQAIRAGEGESWQTEIPSHEISGQALDAQYKKKLWHLEPGEAESASWFKAGVVTTEGQKVHLLDHYTGERITSHSWPEAVDLNEDLQWVAEFYHEDTPAVGLRIADTFTAMTSEGEVQVWEIPAEADISVYGATPVVHDDSDSIGAQDAKLNALVVGEDQPVELTVNPAMTTRAVDGKWITQLDIGVPRVALNPVDRDDEELQPHAVELKAPKGDAEFIRHLDAGHGYAMALWQTQGDLYLGVHDLSPNAKGQVTALLPAPFEEQEATGWAIGNGMEVFVVGPYAISMSTGALIAFSDEGDISRAYGSAAVTETQNQRFFIADNTKYTESERIIGYSEQGIILVRLIDGSIAAYGDYGGIA